jgi:Ca2+-binding EF-hand superfamily protein
MSLGGELSNLVRKTFDLYDDDHSGSLDPFELQLFLDDMAKIFKIPKLNPRQYQWALKSFDADGSGTIEFDELYEGMGIVIEKLASGYLGDECNHSSSSDGNSRPQSPSKQDPDETPINNPKYIKNLATKIKLLQRINNKKELKIEKKILHSSVCGTSPEPRIPEDCIDKESATKSPSPFLPAGKSSHFETKNLGQVRAGQGRASQVRIWPSKKNNSTFAPLENLVNKKLTQLEKQKLTLLETEKLKSWSNNKIFSNDPADPDDIDIDEYLRKAVDQNFRHSLMSRPSLVDGFAKIDQDKDGKKTVKKSNCKKKLKKFSYSKGSDTGVGVGGFDNEIFLKFESGEPVFVNQKYFGDGAKQNFSKTTDPKDYTQSGTGRPRPVSGKDSKKVDGDPMGIDFLNEKFGLLFASNKNGFEESCLGKKEASSDVGLGQDVLGYFDYWEDTTETILWKKTLRFWFDYKEPDKDHYF